MKRFVLREEIFGFTLFDRVKMRHKFIPSIEPKNMFFQNQYVENYELWSSNLSSIPNDIIYSPIRVYFEFTLACNLRCRTCFNTSGIAKPEELSTKEVKKTLDGLRKDNVLDIRFSGGETTQRKDWYEILKYAKALGL